MYDKPDVDEMDEPPNLPDNLEEKCYRVFKHVGGTSRTPKLYHYPMMEQGPKDHDVMLEVMDLADPGTIFRVYDRVYVTTDTWNSFQKGKDGQVKNTCLEAMTFNDQHKDPGDTRRWVIQKDRPSVKNLWEKYLYGDVERLGHVLDNVPEKYHE